MSNLKLIMRREFISRVRNRTFVVMTFLSPLIMVGMVCLIAWLTTINADEIDKIIVFDETGLFVEDLKNDPAVTYIDYSHLSLKKAKDSVVLNNLNGLLYIPKKENNKILSESILFFTNESPDNNLIYHLEEYISTKLTAQNFKINELDLAVINKSKAAVTIGIENFYGEQTSKMSTYIKMIFGGVAGYLLMMFIIIYGNMVMRSVIEEKANRIVEIIISSVKPLELMAGKIIGTSFAGILQFLIWVLLGGVLLSIVTTFFGVQADPIAMNQAMDMAEGNQGEMQLILSDILKLPLATLVISFFIFFMGGYFLYSSIYAAIGAAVNSESDSQQFMLPVLLPLMLGIYVGFFSVIESPHGTIATVFSMIPLTSPVVMLMRIPFGVPLWQVLVSIVLLIGTIVFVAWLAAKIYKIGILMYGKKPSYRELFKWLKY